MRGERGACVCVYGCHGEKRQILKQFGVPCPRMTQTHPMALRLSSNSHTSNQRAPPSVSTQIVFLDSFQPPLPPLLFVLRSTPPTKHELTALHVHRNKHARDPSVQQNLIRQKSNNSPLFPLSLNYPTLLMLLVLNFIFRPHMKAYYEIVRHLHIEP